MKTFILFFLLNLSFNSTASKPELLLAKIYQPNIELDDYWISEKLDGVRAYWDGKNLLSRQGYKFNAPKWFTKPLPKIALDGELWIGRNQFSKVSGLVRRQDNNPLNWLRINYMIFDLPFNKKPFDHRIVQMRAITTKANMPHFQTIHQFKLSTHNELKQKLDAIVSLGGEGLMLHRGSSFYKSGRSDDLLKLKQHMDAEAIVMKHINGKGKFVGMLGAILVETHDGIRFKIGTGFTNEERKNPPSIGSTVTYKYFGLTSKGKPRFASFMRIRTKH